MFNRILWIILGITILSFNKDSSFKKEQLKFKRVKMAYTEKWGSVKAKLIKADIDTSHFEIFIRAFKHEGEFEVWAKSKEMLQFKLVETYAICSASGELGPKCRQGDGQVPEGFYQVSVFNPTSNYHLSLGLNYPNKSDRLLGVGRNLGGDIMIHGNCVTIGCIPLTDDKIKEVYIMAVEARNKGQQNIQVHIFPTHLTNKGLQWLNDQIKDEKRVYFWNNLKDGYAFFEDKKNLPQVVVNEKGKYVYR